MIVSTDLNEMTLEFIISSALIKPFFLGTSFFKIGIYFALTALSYSPLVKNEPTKFAIAMVNRIGMNMFIDWAVSIVITARE